MKLLTTNGNLSQNAKDLITDIKSKNFSDEEIVQKYGMKNNRELHTTTRKLRVRGLLPRSLHAERGLKAWATRRKNATTHTTKGMKYSKITDTSINTKVSKSNSAPLTDYRTLYFGKDFLLQIHKKAMARLVVDHNNNLHILNS